MSKKQVIQQQRDGLLKHETGCSKSRTCYKTKTGGHSSDFDKNIVNMLNLLNAPVAFKKATLLVPEKVTATWFVVWYNLNPDTGKLERIRKTFNLNRIPELAKRKELGDLYCSIINEALKRGWNIFDKASLPMVNSLPALQAIQQPAQHWSEQVNRKYATISAALDAMLKQKSRKLTHRSAQTYKNCCKTFLSFLALNNFDQMPPEDITPEIINDYIEYRLDNGIKNTTINTEMTKVGPLFTMLQKGRYIPVNPLKYVDWLPKEDSTVFEPLTQQELNTIASYLRYVHPRFFLFTQFIFFSYIRPYHVAQLRRLQIDFDKNIISIEGHSTKNKKNSQIQLFEALKRNLLGMGIDKLKGEKYIFGKDFLPSNSRFQSLSTRASQLWHQYVHIDLKINKKMYALKHTGGSIYLNENDSPDLGFLQKQMQHSSLEQTNIYVSKRKMKKIDESKVTIGNY